MKVAWIGLGQMGLPTARIVAKGGHEVRAYDVRSFPEEQTAGLHICATPQDAAEDCEILCLAVFSDDQVEDVLFGPGGVMPQLNDGTVVAIYTTGSIDAIQDIAARAKPGVFVLDTCFSRMFEDQSSGMLTLLVGGDAAAIERGRPVFDTFARSIRHMGANGTGRAIKLVNNILFAGHIQLAADALRLAQGLGLDPQLSAATLTACSGASDVLNNFRKSDPGPFLDMSHRYMVKDVGAAIDAARDAGVTLSALARATEIYAK